MFGKHPGLAMIALLLALGSVHASIAKDAAVSLTMTTVSDYRAGSAEAAQVRAWLQAHAQFVNGAMVGEPAKLGNAKVTRTKVNDRPLRTQGAGDGASEPLPGTGVSGDSISISTDSAGISQDWNYVWTDVSSGNGWKLDSYHWSRDKLPDSSR